MFVMHLSKLVAGFRLALGLSLALALGAPSHAQLLDWEGDVSSNMEDSQNWVGAPVIDFVNANHQMVFGAVAPTASVTPQTGVGDNGKNWASPTAAGANENVLTFDADAPAYTFGDGGNPLSSIALYNGGTGQGNMINLSANTQTFDVDFRIRTGIIDAAAGDIVFNRQFFPGDVVNNTTTWATFQGDHDIYLNGTVIGHTSTTANRSRIFYDGASTTAENSGKLYLGDIGTVYRGKIIVGSQRGGAVVATHNNSFGDPTTVSGGNRDTYIGDVFTGGFGALSNGVVEIDGTAGDLTIAENFWVETRTLANGAPHIRNTAGNNTLSGFISSRFDGGVDSGADALIIESDAGTLRLTGTVSQNIPNKTGNLYLQGDSNGEIGPDLFGVGIVEGGVGSVFNTVKRGDGDWTILTGTTNTYVGTTTVEDGTYIMNGTHATGAAYTVNDDGTLGGSGTIGSTVALSGTLAPGESAGTLTVGGLTLSGGILDFELDAANHTAGLNINDLIVSTGAVDLTGGAMLNVTGIGGPLTAGDYDLIQFSGFLSGNASDITLGTIPVASGLSASILIDTDSVNLRIAEGSDLPGDYNGDDVVNAADYALWRDGGSPDSTVGGYNLWRANFGAGGGSGSGLSNNTAIPEPASATLAVLGLLIVGLLRSATRRSR